LKRRLTAADKRRLTEIEGDMVALPSGESSDDIEAMEIIRRAAEALKNSGRA